MNKAIYDEIRKCVNIFYFTEKYVKIAHPKHGIVSFELYDYQKKLLSSYFKNRFNIVLKARQLGISTLTALYCLHRAYFKNNQNILICATKLDTAKNMIGIVRTMYKHLPKFFIRFNGLTTDNVTSIGFKNGSIIQSVTTTEDIGRSQALSLLIIDEAAWVKKPYSLDKLWASIRPTLATGGDCIMISTPNGIGDKFHQLYKEAEEGKNEFVPHKLMWYLRYDKEWFERESKDKTPQEIAQEYCCEFIGSGRNVVPVDTLFELQKEVGLNIEGKLINKSENDMLHYIIDGMKENSINVMFCDVSRGENYGDYNAFVIFDIVSKEQIVDFKGKVDVQQFANIVIKYAFKYDAPVVVENNGIGYSLISVILSMYRQNNNYSIEFDGKVYNLSDLKIVCETTYKNLTEIYEALINVDGIILEEDVDIEDFVFYFYSDDLRKSMIAVPLKYMDVFCRATNAVKGFTISGKSRDIEITTLINSLVKRKVKINLQRVIDELYSFVWKGNKAMAENKCHDDLVMSFAAGCLFMNEIDKNANLDVISMSYNVENNPKIINSLLDNISADVNKAEDLKNAVDGKQDLSKFNWILK